MGTNEPPILPTYAAEVYPDRWYCFFCPQHRDTLNSICIHLGATHDITDPKPQIDYGDGEMVSLVQLQRSMWESEVEHRFARALDSLLGADDFVFEAGGDVA